MRTRSSILTLPMIVSLLTCICASTALARSGTPPDTTWFGGTDAGGTAVQGGIWDFEDGTIQVG